MTLIQLANTNLGSSMVGGLVVGFILYITTGTKERRSYTRRIRLFLVADIEELKNKIAEIQKQLKKGQVSLLPSPFTVPAIEIALNGRLVELMSPEAAEAVIHIKYAATTMNTLYDKLVDYHAGTLSGLPDPLKPKQAIFEGMKKHLPSLVNDCDKAISVIGKK